MTEEKGRESLTDEQLQALLDILSHYEVYQEIRDFRSPDSLAHYGPPFTYEAGHASKFPSLQALLSKFVLTLPGLKDVADGFWHQQVAAIITDLENAELSESYDKGLIGIRKTLATAVSALVEYPARAVFAGFQAPDAEDKERQYNSSDAEDLRCAFRDLMHQAVYGNMLDELFAKAAETDKLTEHSSLVQAAHEYILVNFASFMHYTLILSPKGQSLLTLVDRANKLIPYTIMKQTLKIGNVASMINAMVKVVLAKMSITSVTNWMGFTKNEDEGQNLLQHVISQVLLWDVRDLKAKAGKVEKEKNAPSKEQLESIKGYLHKSRKEHETMRQRSRTQNKSIIHTILSSTTPPMSSPTPTPHQHRLLQDYLTLHLSIRDRQEIIRVLCHSNPDHLTQGVRDLVKAYEPIIRNVHNAVDLSETLGDFERFLADTIKLAKVPDSGTSGKSKSSTHASSAPTVGDFVLLLKRHVGASHKFLHQCAKNGPEVTSWFHEYITQAAGHFQQQTSTSSSSLPSPETGTGIGALTQPLQTLFASLPSSTQTTLLPLLTARASYLHNLHTSSFSRLGSVITSTHQSSSSHSHPHPVLSALANNNNNIVTSSSSRNSSAPQSRSESPAFGLSSGGIGMMDVNPGPGAYLARWQDLLDSTAITPAVATGGEVRSGGSGAVLRASRVDVDVDVDIDAETEEISQSQSGNENEKEKAEEKVFEDVKSKIEALDMDVDDGNGDGDGDADADSEVPPDVGPVVKALGKAYRELLAERSCTW